jgi:hypothetical protein
MSIRNEPTMGEPTIMTQTNPTTPNLNQLTGILENTSYCIGSAIQCLLNGELDQAQYFIDRELQRKIKQG